MISVTGTVCSADNISKENADKCSDITLNSASFLLQVDYLVHSRSCHSKIMMLSLIQFI